MIKIKRIYEAPTKEDGYRILVDRLWPRGISKTRAHLDLWIKEIAPSDVLRKWFEHDPKKWGMFKKKYFAELKSKSDLISQIIKPAKKGLVTLLYAAKDEEFNNAIALKEYLDTFSS